MFDVEGMNVVVSGGGRGIGRTLALQLASAGATVVVCSRTRADLEEVAAEAARSGGQVIPVVADVSSGDGCAEMITRSLEACGRIDALVNNAGWDRRRRAIDYDEDEFDQIIGINLKSAYFASTAVARAMIDQGSPGAIVNVTSQAGLMGSMHRAPYSAAKAGLINLTRALASEWGPHGIRVNAVAPGVTMTDPVRRALKNRPQFADELRDRILLGRPADVEEMSAPILFLLTKAAAMITGHTLVVDGGWTASWSNSPSPEVS